VMTLTVSVVPLLAPVPDWVAVTVMLATAAASRSVQRGRPALLLFLDVALQCLADDPG
jgi:hypothetical protein